MKKIFINVMVLLFLVSAVSAVSLTVTSDPDGASVYVNNALRGTTPLTIDISPMKTAIKVTLRDYKDVTKVVVAGERTTHFVLAPLKEDKSRTNSIRIESEPSSAEVYVNGVLKGTTPRVLDHLVIGKDYTIQVLKKGYHEYMATMQAGNNIMAKLAPLVIGEEEKPIERETKKERHFGKIKQATPTTEELSFGMFSITSQPAGANVYVDGVLIGKAPVSTKVISVQLHEIKVTMDGYHDYSARKSVDPEETETINAILVAMPTKVQTGDLYVTSNPTGAEVFVDKIDKGITPLTIHGLRAGDHIIKIAKSGYKDYVSTKGVSPNRVINIGANLMPKRGGTSGGSVLVKASQEGASVYIDDVLKGETPLVLSLDAGSYKVTVKKDGFNDFPVIVKVTGNKIVNIMAKLVAVPVKVGKGNINVKSIPLRAQVFVNGELKGITPLTLPSVPVGQYDIKVSMDGYDDYTTTVAVDLSKTANVWATLKK